MAVLKNSRHEQFVQLVATGKSPEAAYLAAGYGGKGSAASASRLLKNAKVSARLCELRQEVAQKSLKVAISDRNKRLELLQDTIDRLNCVIQGRAEDLKDVPSGDTGALMRDFKGKDATPIYPLDHGLFQLRNETLKQAAIEEGQWSEKREIRGKLEVKQKPYDLSQLSAEALSSLLALLEEAQPREETE